MRWNGDFPLILYAAHTNLVIIKGHGCELNLNWTLRPKWCLLFARLICSINFERSCFGQEKVL